MSGYQNRLDRRDLILAIITAIIGVCATIIAAAGILVLTGAHL